MRQIVSLGCLVVVILAGALVFNSPRVSQAEPASSTPGDLKTRLRYPVALVLADDGRRLFVANQRSGTISVIDTRTLRTTAEIEAGRKLADLVATPEGPNLLALDEELHTLQLFERVDSTLKPAQRLPIGPTPVSVQVAGSGKWCSVASLWSRQIM